MRVLGINTVGDVCEAALVADGAVVAVCSEPMRQGHDARLAPLVEQLMQDAGRSFADIDRIAVIVGPGSFTGLRVGIAFARGLALALDKPAVGVSSLEAMAQTPTPVLGRSLGALAAKRRPPEQSWWAQVLVDGRGASEPVEADAAQLTELAAGVARALGQGLEDLALPIPVTLATPSAIGAAVLVTRFAADALPPATPIYVRAPDAKPMARP